MQRSRVLGVSNYLRRLKLWGKVPAAVNDPAPETILDQEREEEETRRKARQSVEAQRIAGIATREHLDQLTARGLCKVKKPYQPPADLESILASLVAQATESALESGEDWRLISLADSGLKFGLLELCRARLGRSVPNSALHRLKIAGDVLQFYQEPASNLTGYAQMARDRDLPANLTMVEHNPAFHPDDKDAPHGGVTAYPGLSRYETDLRHKAVYREFRAKHIKSHYEEVGFDYTEDAPANSPWNAKASLRADRIGYKHQYLMP